MEFFYTGYQTPPIAKWYEIEEAARYYYEKQLDKMRRKYAAFAIISPMVFIIISCLIYFF